MSRYGFFIRNNRTGQMINLLDFAKVFHTFSGRADGGNRQPVPAMTHLTRPWVTSGSGFNASYSGDMYAWAKPVSDFGLAGHEGCWHALTPIYHGDINQLEGRHGDLESCVPTMCIFNPDDRHFYTSRSAVYRRSDIPPNVIVGVVYG